MKSLSVFAKAALACAIAMSVTSVGHAQNVDQVQATIDAAKQNQAAVQYSQGAVDAARRNQASAQPGLDLDAIQNRAAENGRSNQVQSVIDDAWAAAAAARKAPPASANFTGQGMRPPPSERN